MLSNWKKRLAKSNCRWCFGRGTVPVQVGPIKNGKRMPIIKGGILVNLNEDCTCVKNKMERLSGKNVS